MCSNDKNKLRHRVHKYQSIHISHASTVPWSQSTRINLVKLIVGLL